MATPAGGSGADLMKRARMAFCHSRGAESMIRAKCCWTCAGLGMWRSHSRKLEVAIRAHSAQHTNGVQILTAHHHIARGADHSVQLVDGHTLLAAQHAAHVGGIPACSLGHGAAGLAQRLAQRPLNRSRTVGDSRIHFCALRVGGSARKPAQARAKQIACACVCACARCRA